MSPTGLTAVVVVGAVLGLLALAILLRLGSVTRRLDRLSAELNAFDARFARLERHINGSFGQGTSLMREVLSELSGDSFGLGDSLQKIGNRLQTLNRDLDALVSRLPVPNEKEGSSE